MSIPSISQITVLKFANMKIDRWGIVESDLELGIVLKNHFKPGI